MGCGSSAQLPDRPAVPVVKGQTPQESTKRQGNLPVDNQPSVPSQTPENTSLKELLTTPKWLILMDWCGWHDKDQFGFKQPAVREILGPSGRSKLGGHERPHAYQVAVSFPGAEFVKGDHGHCSNLTDASGRLIATNGAEMAEAVRGWLVEDWLGGDMRRGLTHVFIDKLNLQYCAGSVRAVNFGRGNPDAYAVLNENWAIYLREAFLEARVVVFLLNQDWLDSIPCNQEFEGLIRRKSTYTEDGGSRGAVVFVDITDPDYKGRLLPQYFANMREQASRFFDVHSISYNETLTPDQKRAARQSLTDIVRKYGTAYEAPAVELQDMASTTVQWRNWLYFRCLEGTNGWQELVDVQDLDWKKAIEESGEARWPRPVFQCTTTGVLSRRFRLRVTRLGDGRFGEIQLRGWELFDAASGENIVRPGNGYIRAAGGLNPASIAMIDVEKGAWCHQCGNRQYTWLEWLVPDEQPPVAVSHMRLSQHPVTGPDWNDTQCPVDFTLECLPVEVWPAHGPEFVAQYEHPMTPDDVTNLAGDKPPRWVQLHAVSGATAAAATATSGSDGGWMEYVVDPSRKGVDQSGGPALEAAPACTTFRLRVTEVRDAAVAAEVEIPGLRLQVVPRSDLRLICGGACSGTGGGVFGERCGPAAAFDGNPFTRWVDAGAGGIGNTATWEYTHPSGVTIEEYAITSQIGTFGVLDGLHGAPRDWTLYTFRPRATGEEALDTPGTADEGGAWVELDRQADVIFTNPRQTKRFPVANPAAGSRYRLVFTAVRCGCASSSLQVGDIELLARCAAPSAPELLTRSHLLLHPSASHADMREARWATDDPTRLQLSLPIHTATALAPLPQPPLQSTEASSALSEPERQQHWDPAGPVVGLAGASVRWGGAAISNWYEWPMEFRLQCNEIQDGDVVRYGSQPTITYRTDRNRVDYGPDSIWATVTFDDPVELVGYGLRNHFEAQPRGEPRSWRLEAWNGPQEGDGKLDNAGGKGDAGAAEGGDAVGGCWEALHEVPWVDYDTRLSCGTFHLPAPSRPARRFRLVFTEWTAPCPLAHLHSMHFLGRRRPAPVAPAAAARPDASSALGPPLQVKGSDSGGGSAGGVNAGAREAEQRAEREGAAAKAEAEAGAEEEQGEHGVGEKQRVAAEAAETPLRFRELASVDMVLRKRHGAVRLERYWVLVGGDQSSANPGAPVSWVLEGLTTEY